MSANDAVVDELMTDEWQSHYYTFSDHDEAIAWLAWVVEDWGGPDHVDGLVGIGQVVATVTGRGQEVVEHLPA